MGGKLQLRIEDIDTPRTKIGASEQAIEDLRWLGITWDGEPIYQTSRRERYSEIVAQLRQQNLIYPCLCTRRDIDLAGSAPHFEHEGRIYPGTCAGWQNGDVIPGQSHCWRFRTRDETIYFDDRCEGRQSCNPAKHLGDFPITQKTGDASYQLAVVVDDHDCGINQVVRGYDLLVSTFRQLLVHRALNWPAANYAHVPLVIGRDGHRLAKRHGDTRLSQYRERGLKPMQVVRWAAISSGLVNDPTLRINHIDEVIKHFDWSKLNKVATQVDEQIFELAMKQGFKQ